MPQVLCSGSCALLIMAAEPAGILWLYVDPYATVMTNYMSVPTLLCVGELSSLHWFLAGAPLREALLRAQPLATP